MANRSRDELLRGVTNKKRDMIIPLVAKLHPATTVITKFTKQYFEEALSQDPCLPYVTPLNSILVTYKKLPNLQVLLCKNDQNSLVSLTPQPSTRGYFNNGCKCLVCKASNFSKYVRPPSLPGYAVKIPSPVHCKSGPALIYHIVCHSKRPECQMAHYVGRAYSSDPKVYPMAARWSNHKSHAKHGINQCELTDHLINFHKGEDPQTFLKLQILQAAPTLEEIKPLEIFWTRKLFALQPTGLNKRKEAEAVNQDI